MVRLIPPHETDGTLHESVPQAVQTSRRSAGAVLACLETTFSEERCKLPHVLFAEALHCSVQGTGQVATALVDELNQVNLQQLAPFFHQSLRLVPKEQLWGEVW